MKAIIIVLCIFSIGFADTLAHSGRTDSYGGHWNRKKGTYHYHSKKESSNFLLYSILGGGAGLFLLSRNSDKKK
jgi:hypothetical protein